MSDITELEVFLQKHNFLDINVQELGASLYKDMTLGLEGQGKSQQLMAVMPFPVQLQKRTGNIIVIDAGGTNFRSCLVNYSSEGEIAVSEERKSSMIALDREYTKEEFFDALEDKISYLKNKAEEIHFCFSYAIKNTPEGDAQVLAFSKQVMAKAVEGSYIGKELLQVLKQKGWTTVKNIKVINDTVACLFAGLSLNAKQYGAYIGFILGTGINNAYIEKAPIGKLKDNLQEHVVVCESGMFTEVKLSDFDIVLDMQSTNPDSSLLEKMCSGVYIGKIAQLIISAACKENLFSYSFAHGFELIRDLSAYQISLFLEGFASSDNILENICVLGESPDRELLIHILKLVILRSAKISSCVILATVLKANPPKDKPVCITCNGSTFWKTTELKKSVETLLLENLTLKYGINFEIVKIENDITVGTAMV